MGIGFSIFSMGFIARFLLAFIIIAFLYSRNKNDPSIKKGFTILGVLGGVVLILGIIIFIFVVVTSGAAFLGDSLINFRFHF